MRIQKVSSRIDRWLENRYRSDAGQHDYRGIGRFHWGADCQGHNFQEKVSRPEPYVGYSLCELDFSMNGDENR